MEDYTKSCPPGWQPYMHNYPLKLYKERLSLWLRITDVAEEKLGPIVLGRIKGSAYRLIMKIRLPRQPDAEHGWQPHYLTADAAIAAPAQVATPAVEAWMDDQGNHHPARPAFAAQPSGVDMMLQILD